MRSEWRATAGVRRSGSERSGRGCLRQTVLNQTTMKGNSLMVVTEIKPERVIRSATENELRVERTEILFHDLDRDTVEICVTVHNDGEERSLPTVMTLESAPLGAFVPWRPLTRLRVPALEPGEAREIRTRV